MVKETVALQVAHNSVAGEELVATISAQRDLDMSGRELRNQIGRYRRRVAKRLVEVVYQLVDQRHRIGPHHDVVMVGLVFLRYQPSIGELVIRTLLKTD